MKNPIDSKNFNQEIESRVTTGILKLLCQYDMPVGITLKNGNVLQLKESEFGSGQIVDAFELEDSSRKQYKIDPHKIKLDDLMDIVKNGKRGAALEKLLQEDSKKDASQAYDQLKASLVRGDLMEHFDILERYQATIKGNTDVVGKIYKESAADGHAYYMVTRLHRDQALLKSLPVCDGYRSASLGEGAWVDEQRVRKVIAADEAMTAMFATRRTPRP